MHAPSPDLTAHQSLKLVIRRVVYNKLMLDLVVHHAKLQQYPDVEGMHAYYKDHFGFDPTRKFGEPGYATEANLFITLLCPKLTVAPARVHESVRPRFS